MFVYFLVIAGQKRIKIGKANDVHDRIMNLGTPAEFDLDASQCIQLQTEVDAKHLERILHRVFRKSRLPINKANRYQGDTEHFDIECFDRVKRFLVENADLNGGALPQSIPAAQPRVAATKKTWEERQLARADKLRLEQEMAEQQFNNAMLGLGVALTQLAALGLEVYEQCAKPYPVINIETSNRELFDRAMGLINEMQMLRFSPTRRANYQSHMVGGMILEWDEDRGRGIAQAGLDTPMPGERKADWDPEYVALFDLIPVSQTPRPPLRFTTLPKAA